MAGYENAFQVGEAEAEVHVVNKYTNSTRYHNSIVFYKIFITRW